MSENAAVVSSSQSFFDILLFAEEMCFCPRVFFGEVVSMKAHDTHVDENVVF